MTNIRISAVLFLFVAPGIMFGSDAAKTVGKDLYAGDWPMRYAACRPVPLAHVEPGGYLGTRIKRNLRSVSAGLESAIPRGFEARAAGKALPPEADRLAADSDLYKWLEGACYMYVQTRSEKLKQAIDRIAGLIVACQADDGYINTQVPPRKRFDPGIRHDLYIAGHFFEAAAAHYRATGERVLLDAACRWAEYLLKEFENGNPYFTNTQEHPEYELGLLRLGRAAGERRYRDFSAALARRLSGVGPDVADIRAGGGLHAVRVGYLLAGLADLYLETGLQQWIQFLPDLWSELVQTRMYITGAIGSHGEQIGKTPFDLPHTRSHPHRAMGETCASVAMIMFSWRMHGITGESRYFDVIERILYNHYLGAIALNGLGTFYYNPMRMTGDQRNRTDHWHRPATARCMLPELNRTSCCITNCWRFLGALPEYIYSFDDDGFFVNLYTTSEVQHTLPDGRAVGLSVETSYPHQGDVTVRFTGETATKCTLRFRIPAWCTEAKASWPGRSTQKVQPGSYLSIDRLWKEGDTVRLDFAMPVRMVLPDPRIKANEGQVVFARGPLFYCLEKEDCPVPVENVRVAISPEEVAGQVNVTWKPDLLDGINILMLPALAGQKEITIKLVPWSVRANRSDDSRWIIFIPYTEM